MNHRLATVLAEESIATAATKIIDLDMSDVISRIQINLEVEGDGTPLSDHLAAVFSNIELIDGSDVLFSLSGKECQALDYWQTGQMPFNALTEQDGQDMIAVFNINFGRFLYDEALAFDPTKFRNPQLKITHDYTACGSVSTVARMEVRAFLFDEKAATPGGFLMSKEHYQYTCGSQNTYEYIDMPTDYLTRRYMLLGTAANKVCQQVINEVRLSEDNAKRIPYDTKVWQLLKMLHQMYPRIEEYGHFYLKNGGSAIYASPTQNLVFSAAPAAVTNIVSMGSSPATMPITADITADGYASVQISGNDPHYSFILPCGKPDDPADWYDVSKLGNLKMRLKAGSAETSGVVEVVTEQLRRY